MKPIMKLLELVIKRRYVGVGASAQVGTKQCARSDAPGRAAVKSANHSISHCEGVWGGCGDSAEYSVAKSGRKKMSPFARGGRQPSPR